MELSLNEAILRLFLALILGSVVGIERELSQQSAGLRTHILVCLGATAFTIVSISDMTQVFLPASQDMIGIAGVDYRIVRDPARIAAQIVAGIGFIGGGAVLRHGASVRGLTTAASLWMMASIGMLIGIGMYYVSVAATLFSFLVLFTLGALEHRLFQKYQKQYSRMRIRLTVQREHLDSMKVWMDRQFGKEILEVKTTKDETKKTAQLTYILDVAGATLNVNDISREMESLPGITSSGVSLYSDESM